jgi:hypothetical protein
MSFALKIQAQSSIIFGGGRQFVISKEPNRFDPIGLYFGCEFAKEKVLRWSILADYNWNRYNYTSNLSNSVKEQLESREVSITNNSFAIGGGPALYLDITDEFQFKISPMIFIASVNSKGIYADKREYLTSPGTRNISTTNKTIILNQQQHQESGVQPYFKIMTGIDLHLKRTLGVEVGWQSIDFGRTMNKLNPEKEFAKETTNLHTSQLLAGVTFKF